MFYCDINYEFQHSEVKVWKKLTFSYPYSLSSSSCLPFQYITLLRAKFVFFNTLFSIFGNVHLFRSWLRAWHPLKTFKPWWGLCFVPGKDTIQADCCQPEDPIWWTYIHIISCKFRLVTGWWCQRWHIHQHPMVPRGDIIGINKLRKSTETRTHWFTVHPPT